MNNIDIPNNISIVGCGTLGSSLAYMLALRHKDNNIDKLTLIDNDILEDKNLPYITMTSKEYLYLPKVMVLRDILTNISDINIEIYYETYPQIDISDDSYMIDCRDTSSECSNFSLKLNIDGYYGFINRGPKDIPVVRSSRYTINNSNYYSILFAGIITRYIFGDVDIENVKTIIDLRKGTLYGVFEKKESGLFGL